MFWKNWPYWLKVGIIFTITELIFYFWSLMCWQGCSSRGALTYDCLKCPIPPGQGFLLYLLNFLPYKYRVAINVNPALLNLFRCFGFALPFIIGAIMGLLYEKKDKIILKKWFRWILIAIILVVIIFLFLKP